MTEKDDNIKAEILTQAQRLFRHYGIKKTTMEDIAKATEKGKSTLYYYYKSKEEIFYEVVMVEIEDVFSLTRKAVDKAPTAEEKLKAYSLTKFKALQEKVNLYRVVKGDIEANYQHFVELNQKYETRELELVQNILRFGLERGEFTGFALSDIESLAYAMVCAVRGLEIGLLVKNRFADLEERLQIIHNIIINGIKASRP